MKKERNIYIDVLKAFSILLVVFGHCIQYGAGGDYGEYYSFFYHPVFKFIYSFHMPLFMLISGFLFAYSCKNKDWQTVLKSKACQLLIPLAGWSVVSTMIQIIKMCLGVSAHKFSIIWMFQNLYAGFQGGPWFLWAMWWGVVVVLVGKYVFKDNPIVYALVCLTTFFIPDGMWPATYKFMLPFFILSYAFNAHDWKTKLKKFYMHPVCIIACVGIFAYLLSLYDYDTYIYTSGYYIFQYENNHFWQLHNNVLRFFVGLFGSISISYLIYGLVSVLPEKINKVIAYVGSTTLGVYILSNYIFDEMHRLSIPGFSYLYLIIETIVIMAVCVLLTVGMQKSKILNRILLGGR